MALFVLKKKKKYNFDWLWLCLTDGRSKKKVTFIDPYVIGTVFVTVAK